MSDKFNSPAEMIPPSSLYYAERLREELKQIIEDIQPMSDKFSSPAAYAERLEKTIKEQVSQIFELRQENERLKERIADLEEEAEAASQLLEGMANEKTPNPRTEG